jgi:hypothetical protein
MQTFQFAETVPSPLERAEGEAIEEEWLLKLKNVKSLFSIQIHNMSLAACRVLELVERGWMIDDGLRLSER